MRSNWAEVTPASRRPARLTVAASAPPAASSSSWPTPDAETVSPPTATLSTPAVPPTANDSPALVPLTTRVSFAPPPVTVGAGVPRFQTKRSVPTPPTWDRPPDRVAPPGPARRVSSALSLDSTDEPPPPRKLATADEVFRKVSRPEPPTARTVMPRKVPRCDCSRNSSVPPPKLAVMEVTLSKIAELPKARTRTRSPVPDPRPTASTRNASSASPPELRTSVLPLSVPRVGTLPPAILR